MRCSRHVLMPVLLIILLQRVGASVSSSNREGKAAIVNKTDLPGQEIHRVHCNPYRRSEVHNDYPIVLVHGFLGWGRDEVPGLLYWGGFEGDFQESLRRAGHETFTGVVGPLSSIWDRATELFAFIRGGTVDYGRVHSAKFEHNRFGATFEGLYPQWGTLDECGNVRKIHLIGHSMGGKTSAALTHLLNNGAPEERDESPLFTGGRDWVASVTTLSTPHDGSSLATLAIAAAPLDQVAVASFFYFIRLVSDVLMVDLKLEHFGLGRRVEESFEEYFGSNEFNAFWASGDSAIFDVTPDVSKSLNQRFSAQNNTYYFTWATEATFSGHHTGYELPESDYMSHILFPGGTAIGRFTRHEFGKVVIDESWWQNDGVVNTVSMNGPKVGSSDNIAAFTGTPRRGVWNYMGLKQSWDHLTFIGLGKRNTADKIGERFLLDWSNFLKELPM